VVVTTGAVGSAKLQYIVTTNKTTTSFFTGRMPFLSPSRQCQSTEGRNITSVDLLTPSSPGGLPTLSLTTNSSYWLPGGRVAMPLISPLIPVPLTDFTFTSDIY